MAHVTDPVPAVGVDGVQVRATVRADLRTVARLHRTQLHHGLYPLLGERFLRRYHATLLASPHARNLAVGPVGAPDGFVTALLDPPAHRAWLRGRVAARLALAGLVGLLTHPRALRLFLRTRVRRYARAVLDRGTPVDGAGPAVLLHVAVAPEARGRGVGAALAEAVVTAAGDAGRSTVRLVTQRGSAAEGFYTGTGWSVCGVRPGRDGNPVTEFERATAVEDEGAAA